MAETILSVFAEGVLAKIGSLALSEISSVVGVKKDLKKLEATLSMITAVLEDAEQQQTKNKQVGKWLERLKDVVYDADDVLDTFSTEVLRQQVEVHGSMLKVVGNFFSPSNPIAFRFKIGREIKNIRENLDEIAADRRNFHFTEQVANNYARVIDRVREQTHSFVVASNVIGRDKDKAHIVKLLVSFNDDIAALSVIPIVGLGGLGKTTLAKLVYNDDKVTQNFEVRLWVCVSDDSRRDKVLEKILKSAEPGYNWDGLNPDDLQNHLRNNLCGKRFILVLDDVWNDDPKWWAELRDLLMGGAYGSKVIVTTRSQTIATIVGTVSSYNLSKLPLEDCLSLFWKCSFKEGNEKENPELVDIGKEIVNKCGGVPLAVKTLGSLLYMKINVDEWLYIKNNEIWALKQNENDILSALRLSYEQLPSYLKECFAYCAIFPKDYEIGRQELINLWIAQGLLRSHDTNLQLEDVGNQYFNELLSRSFFQDVVENFDSTVHTFKMHDLVHDLAISVTRTEFFYAKSDSRNINSERVRHVVYYGPDCEEFPISLVCAKKLRSFKFGFYVGTASKPFIDTLVKNFICIRILDLSFSSFDVLPKFIGKLKHLRYLRLSRNRSLKALPNSICRLHNLQTLNLHGCEQLGDLPRDFTKLISLRYLLVTSQMICVREKTLQGLNSLKYLILQNCDRLESLSEGIRHLTSLRELQIGNCPSLDSLPSGLKCLSTLERLVIWECRELNLLEEDKDLQGLRSLRSLYIRELPKLVALPHGLVQSAATLQYLCIRDCSGLTTLPEWLQTLTSLKSLYVINCPNLLCLPEGMQCLTALRELSIRGCPHLIRRCQRETGEDWPKISHIPIIYRE